MFILCWPFWICPDSSGQVKHLSLSSWNRSTGSTEESLLIHNGCGGPAIPSLGIKATFIEIYREPCCNRWQLYHMAGKFICCWWESWLCLFGVLSQSKGLDSRSEVTKMHQLSCIIVSIQLNYISLRQYCTHFISTFVFRHGFSEACVYQSTTLVLTNVLTTVHWYKCISRFPLVLFSNQNFTLVYGFISTQCVLRSGDLGSGCVFFIVMFFYVVENFLEIQDDKQTFTKK